MQASPSKIGGGLAGSLGGWRDELAGLVASVEQDLYSEVAAELEALAGVSSDAALTIGAQLKPATPAAYEIAMPIS